VPEGLKLKKSKCVDAVVSLETYSTVSRTANIKQQIQNHL